MKITILTKSFLFVSCVTAMSYSGFLHAHSGGGVLNAGGDNPSATDLAEVTCFDDGNGTPAYLLAQVRDLSAPQQGQLLNLQLYKGVQATSISDPVSGDAESSPFIRLDGGPGVYRLILNKTGAAARTFDVTWHCETANNLHTGTDIVVRQLQ